MTTAKDIFQVASNPEICHIFAKKIIQLVARMPLTLLTTKEENYYGNGS